MGLFARTKSLALISLLCTVGALGAYIFFAYYTLRTHHANAELAVAVVAEMQKERGLRATDKLLQELAEEEEAISSRFVPADDIVSFIELLETSGKDAGVSLEVASVGIAPEKDAAHEWLTISLKARGAWEKLFHFLVLLETMPFVIELEQAGLKYELEDQAQKGTWEGVFMIRAAKLKSIQP